MKRRMCASGALVSCAALAALLLAPRVARADGPYPICTDSVEDGIPTTVCDEGPQPYASEGVTEQIPAEATIIDDPGMIMANQFGNSTFGAGFSISANVNKGAGTRLLGDSNARIFAKFFGNNIELVAAPMNVDTAPGTLSDARLILGGSTVRSSRFNTGGSFNLQRPYPVAGLTQMILVGPIPVRLRATITAFVAHQGTVSSYGVTPGNFDVNLTPKLGATLTASAAVSLLVVSAGVEGSLNLIQVEFPIHEKAWWTGTANAPVGHYELRVDQKLSTLSGNVSLFAEINTWWYHEKWKTQIAAWQAPAAILKTLDNRSGLL